LIPLAFIQQWTTHAPWPDLRQVEQDLIISRALCDLFKKDELRNRIAFRGGTAINKLIFRSPLRYSEGIDLVQDESDAEAAFGRVWTDLVQRIPGEVWKFTRIAIESLRLSKRPSLLKGEYE